MARYDLFFDFLCYLAVWIEDLGIPGGDYLRESLTNCSDPLAAIEEFQTENGILLPSLRPALPFLDLFEIKRLDFHNSVLEELSENLTNRIAELATRQEFVLGDLSMILCDPYALNTIALSMMKTLHHCVNNDILPRDNMDVVLLTRMMALGLGAWDMIDSQLFREPKLDVNIIIKFLPMITSMMVEDQMRSLTGRPVEEYVHNLKIPADNFILYIKDNSIYDMIAMYYTLQPSISKENVLRHLLRLVWYIHHKLPGARLEALLEGIAPNNEHSEAVHTMYALLVDKVKNYQPQDPVLPPEELDSPLVCVPTPAPL
ncbi:COBRA1 [Mytilus edulis]|uniref:COBRA1 n=1 Tax=Mytilus edulis TaxID=6550 RepID=A0A8S3RG09_MYTED|nr:COBRA1 [Mytilus edulis]